MKYFNIIKNASLAIIATALTLGDLSAQTKSDLFTKQKGKVSQSKTIIDNSDIIDGSLYNKNIFNNSPLLQLNKSGVKAKFVNGSSVPVWIESQTSGNQSRIDYSNDGIKGQCVGHLLEISKFTKITDPAQEMDVLTVKGGKRFLHVKLQQKFKGIPLHGNQIYLHFSNEKIILNGRYIPTPPSYTNTVANISSEIAISNVIEDVKSSGKYRDLSAEEKQLLEYEAPESELVFYSNQVSSTDITLAWKIEIRPNTLDHWEYFINAATGNIIHKQNHTCDVGPTVSTAVDLNGNTQQFGTYLSGTTYYMIDASKSMFNNSLSSIPNNPVGAIWTIDANNTDLKTFQQITSTTLNSWTAKSVSAHHNADSCYRYYKAVHNRESLDGEGGTIISIINVTDGGQQMDNAYWNGKFMAYGNGKQLFKPLAGGLDVASHEMTHGVIQNSANLNYTGQSGAINESMADIFGCMVDRNNWKIGEDVMLASALSLFPSGALRDLSDPHNGGTSGQPCWQPNHMNEFVSTTSDHGGVHVNSGIPSYAFYLFANSISKSVAEKVYYNALSNFLVASSQFIDLRLAIIQSANELYPSDPSVASAAANAFTQVGIDDGNGSTVQNDLPVNPGTEYLLVQGANTNPYTISRINTGASTKIGLSNLVIRNRPSVTDDGSTAYFVDIDGNIVKKNLNNNVTTLHDNAKVWDNVAISKDGSLLAAVSEDIDSTIYVKPASGGSWKKFKLYNPTFTTGIQTSGPQYADVLEWDHKGETVMFDCYNLTVGNNQDTIDYWSIGFINVWDKVSNSYSDGTIKNLFDGLPEYISIGNPTFAKNSPNIVAFDLIDFSDGSVSIIGSNTETGDAGYITPFDNEMLGYPSYSRNDDKVFFTSMDNFGDTAVFSINLNSDKISSSNSSIPDEIDFNIKNPVCYANGIRVLGTKQPALQAVDLKAYPNPFTDEIKLDLNLNNESNIEIELFDIMGKPMKKLFEGEANTGSHEYTFSMSEFDTGTYIIKVKTDDKAGVIKVVKVR